MTLRTLLAGSVNHVPYGVRPLIRHVPGLAAFQRWLVARHLSATPFVHEVNGGPAAGLRFEVTLPLDKAIWAGTYEPEFSGAIARHVAPGDVCYDIGGYRGYMSAVMALNGASEVVVFEPLPGNQKALARLCELNPKLPIRVFAGAAGSADGMLALKIMPDASMGKLATSSFQKGAEAVSEIEVVVRSLDSMVRSGDAPAPDLLKVDVEGAELDVLRGAAETLRTKRPKIFLEAHTGALETACRAELAPYGYNISRLEDRVDVEEFTRHLICLPG